MGRITSSIGLATGFPIQETVDKLLALQGRRRDLLVNQNKRLDAQRTAVTALTAQLVAVQIQVRRLSSSGIFSQRTVSTSDTTLLDAVSTGTPQLGQFQFTPLRSAQAQQLQSSRFATTTQPLGAGAFSFRFGGFIDTGVDLDLLGAGAGLERGKIRITDRSGASAEIDLSLARNIDEVLDAINGNSAIRVRAAVHNDSIRLIDETGATTSNLRVEEVAGATAASLGLAGIDVAASQVDGLDMIALFEDLGLSHLNDGNGVRFDGFLGDLRITLRDGSRLDLDFNKLARSGTYAQATTTAANGVAAQLNFTANKPGPDFGGISISFVDDDTATVGQETIAYDADAKTLVFHIDEGHTSANDIVAAVARNEAVAADFSVTRAQAGDGNGLISTSDTAVTTGPKASATTPGGPNAALNFQARNPGEAYDNVAIRFVSDPAITRGNETVSYDETNPLNRELVFHIQDGSTTANDIIAALARSPAGQLFTANNVHNSSGGGVVATTDTAYTSGGALVAELPATKDISLRQVLDAINATASEKLQASIGTNNNLVLTDLTTDGGFTFKVEQLNGSHAAEDLGLDGAADGGTITGSRLVAGLKTSLVERLNGGKGLGPLGVIQITDRAGATAAVDLSAAETVDDILEAINSAGIAVQARVNDARNGIVVADASGGSGNLVISNGDATNTADKLGLAIDSAQVVKSSGSLRRQVISEATQLRSLNGGGGVAAGTVRITDTTGRTATLSIDRDIETVGGVLEAIDHLGLAIEARINDSGDGILLVDQAHGGSTLKVAEGNGTTARDLSLLAEAKTVSISGKDTQIIDGTSTYRIEISQTDTLQDVVSKVNTVSARVRASIFSDGSTVLPFRFAIFNQSSGKAGELLWDTSEANFTLAESVQAQDALLQIGPPGAGGAIASSSSNTFDGLLPDVSLTVKGATGEPVNVTVAQTDESLLKTVKDFVDAYNKVRDKIKELTRFDETTQTAAILQGDARLLRVDIDLNALVSGRITGAGVFESLEAVGLTIKEDGKLEVNEDRLKERFARSPADITEFFSKKETGLSARFDKLVEQIAGVGDTVLIGRVDVLSRKIEQNQQRIDLWNARLEKQRERLLKSFEHSETIIAKMQSSLAALSSIAPVPILTGGN